jgi:AraC-like DNA-binding protein
MQPIFRTAAPNPALRSWVRHYQIIGLNFRGLGAPPAKAYWPRPASALAFYPRDPETVSRPDRANALAKPRSVLIGQTTGLEYRCGGEDFFVFQVEFLPGALYRLTGGLRSTELTDDFVDAEAVFPRDLPEANRALADAVDIDAMIAIVDTLLLRFVDRAKGRRGLSETASDWAARRLCNGPAPSLSRLADQAGLSTRQMHRAFLDRVGVEPSLFGRIGRFDRLLRARNLHRDWDWLSLALDAGYYDHRHMARDFQAFTGMSPGAFYARELAAPERQFGHAET